VIRDRGRELIAEGAVDLRRRVTSGSTGIPMRTYINHRCWDWWLAAERRSRSWWGVAVGDRSASLTTTAMARRQRLKRALLLNDGIFHVADLSQDGLPRLLQQIVRFRPDFLVGFPTMVAHLARCAAAQPDSARGIALKAVFVTGELLHEDQRAAIAQAFGCPVVNEYGSSETWLMASECPRGRMHITAENVYLEFQPVPGSDGLAEILVTDLRNWGMPLIRYAIGDLGAPVTARCPCGRGLPLLELNAGRLADLAVLPDGRLIDESAFCRVFEGTGGAGVRQFRVIQETVERFSVLIAADRDESLAERVRRAYGAIVGSGATIDIQFVEAIPLEPTGKLRRFVSRLDHPAVRHRDAVPAVAR
jgi:phenylacetate-CoA ligase